MSPVAGVGSRLATVAATLALVVGFLVVVAVVVVRAHLLEDRLYTDALARADVHERIYTDVLADPELAERTRATSATRSR